MLNDRVPLSQIAAARVEADLSPQFLANRGFSALLKNGVGHYTLTLVTPCDVTEMVPMANLLSAQDANGKTISCVTLSDTQIQVTTSSKGGVIADLDFSIVILRRMS